MGACRPVTELGAYAPPVAKHQGLEALMFEEACSRRATEGVDPGRDYGRPPEVPLRGADQAPQALPPGYG